MIILDGESTGIFRHELKYCISRTDYFILRRRLPKLFSYDENTDSNGEYRVRSLYFDTPDDHALTDKVNGFGNREKFRIRLYNGDPSFIRLEKKIKRNSLCSKTTAMLSEDQVKRILKGDAGWMRSSGEPLVTEFYSKMQGLQLRPKTVVEFVRTPFFFPAGNTRITLDRDIRTNISGLVFLDRDATFISVFEADVMEIKYDSFLPELAAMAVSTPSGQRSAFSKYAISRKYD